MKIVVAIKQVRERDAQVRIDAAGKLAPDDIRACGIDLKPLSRKRGPGAPLSAFWSRAADAVADLELLTDRPELFADHELFTAVSLFQTKLGELRELLSHNQRAALRLWRAELAPLLKRVQARLLKVMKRAVGQMS